MKICSLETEGKNLTHNLHGLHKIEVKRKYVYIDHNGITTAIPKEKCGIVITEFDCLNKDRIYDPYV